MHRFLFVIEQAEGNVQAYSPDLPGCVAPGAAREETERGMYEAIQLHVAGLVEDNLRVPLSTSFAECVVVRHTGRAGGLPPGQGRLLVDPIHPLFTRVDPPAVNTTRLFGGRV